MKRAILEVISTIVFLTLIIYFTNDNLELEKRNNKLYENFEKNDLLDVDGDINLSELKSKKNDLEDELSSLLNLTNFSLAEWNNKLNEKAEGNNILLKEIDNLSNKVTELDGTINSLAYQYNVLNNKYNSIIQAKKAEEEERNTYMINNFPTINQYPNYPTGCESVALTLLLKYYGVNLSPNDVIENLKKGDLPYLENGIMYGGNPEIEFVGTPLSANSYGVYEKPIAEVAIKYKSDINIKNDFPFSEVLNLVKDKRPVMVWTSMNLSLPYISSSWIYKPTAEKISWKANEHAVVVIGYNDNQVIISDPIGGKIKYQSKSIFESRYNYYGKKALYY